MNPKVDFYFNKATRWRDELLQLRHIALDCRLIEELKWGCPCYMFQKSNLVLIHAFKDYCALLFFKGALLNDTEGLLVQQTENVQSGRQMRFTALSQIKDSEDTIKIYIANAMEVEKAGLKVVLKKHSELDFPNEFLVKLQDDVDLKNAFNSLTPGRQRGYNLYFSAAKQSETRAARVEKCIPKILDGKGLDD